MLTCGWPCPLLWGGFQGEMLHSSLWLPTTRLDLVLAEAEVCRGVLVAAFAPGQG